MSDLDVVEQHHLQHFGCRIAADRSCLNLGAQFRAKTGEFRLLQCRRRLGIRRLRCQDSCSAGRQGDAFPILRHLLHPPLKLPASKLWPGTRSTSDRSLAMRVGQGTSVESRRNTGRPNLGCRGAQRRPRAQAVDSVRTGAPRIGRDIRRKSFSASTTRKNTRPPRNSHGHTQSGIASVSKRVWNGGA